ncbi:transglutaminase domain-containing protein [Bosea sp. CS1GBMeth4]|uniref:transglutaminase domain-containing protein n=1 Tax=Bosea sp. CS1GBMeth4 TaxID=1892849 RepID=UPI001644FD28|nr:transglutaminase domain-containing protein [Bosea sp. CS1GBMeth4]
MDLRGTDPARFADCGSQPTGILRMACRVGSAAHAISTVYPDKDLDPGELFKAFAAVEGANAVRAALSTGRYSYLLARAKSRLPTNSETCLEEGAGICGNHVEAFLAIMEALGVKARPVQFFYSTEGMRESHIAVEVFFLGGWRFIDVTWGFAVPREGGGIQFKSLEEIRANPDGEGLENAFDAWSLFARANRGDPLAYLRRPELDVLVDGKGLVTVSVPDGPEMIERFEHLPNYVGDIVPERKNRLTSLRFVAQGKYRVSLQVSGQAGCRPQEGDRLLVNGREFSIAGPAIIFDMDREAMLSMRSSQQLCYMVFSEARFAALP